MKEPSRKINFLCFKEFNQITLLVRSKSSMPDEIILGFSVVRVSLRTL